MPNEIRPLGFSRQQIEQYKKFGMKYDKRTERAYIEEYEQPSVCSEADVKELESSIAQTLPAEYREFLLRFNGGRPEQSVHQIRPGVDSVVQYFFPLRSRLATYTLRHALATYQGRIPKSTVPVACDGAGNLFLIELSSENRGKILFWDHEAEAQSGEPSYSNTVLAANTISDFVNGLAS